MNRISPLPVLAALLCATSALAQNTVTPVSNGAPRLAAVAAGHAVTATTAGAARAEKEPVIDGRDDDAVWTEAPTISEFRTFVPKEDETPRFRTTAKVAYDDRYFYAFVRAYDPHPDSILPLLSRRDVRTNSDQLKIVIDSYHDKRSGYEFAVNPAGVKRDYSISNDHEEDGSWDGIWDVATRIDSLGWTAEYRIPLSQLRFSRAPSNTFGFAVWRDVARYGERYAWPAYYPSRFGFVSQLGEVQGLNDLPANRRLEISPYTVAKSTTRATAYTPNSGIEQAWKEQSSVSGGADVKYGVTSNLTLDAAINPDFGQVEADPAQVNLNVFELQLQERRPFFVEGNGIYRFDLNCNDGNCTGLFYSRRIGRAPQLSDWYADEDTPAQTSILGATKLSGRLSSGLSVGILNATTQHELGARIGTTNDRYTVEPLTNYFVARLRQDLRDGKSGIGTMFTAVNRSLDQYSDSLLRRAAYAGGLDARHRFAGDRYELNGYVVGSAVLGDTGAIRRTQERAVHFYQREGAHLSYDPGRTSLVGDAEQLFFNKVDGGITRFSVGYQRFSPGFEINDVGYVQRADQQSANGWMGLMFNRPRLWYRRGQLNFNAWSSWNTNGLRLNAGGNVNTWYELWNQWQANAGIGVDQLSGSYNDRSAQGGPAVYRSPVVMSWWGISGDQRWRVVPALFGNYSTGDYGNTSYLSLSPQVDARVGGRFSVSLSPGYTHSQDDTQIYFGYPGWFSHLDYHEFGLGTRLNYTATTNLSLQVYAQPFIATGDQSNLRQIADPTAREYGRRFRPVLDTLGRRVDPADFTYKQLRMNTVLRWEYRPGSTLYVVWSQDRDDSYDSSVMAPGSPLEAPGNFQPRRNFDRLFSAHPKNTLLIKASYWFSL